MKDLIERQAAIDAICNSECESKFCGIPCPEVAALECLPPAEFAKNLQPTCNEVATDDINIQETDGVYEHCDDCIHEADSIDICILRQCKHAIAELKECYEPKQPDRKQGNWIFQGNRSKTLYGWYFCSECGAYRGGKCNFCSECGADMREVQEDE